MQQQRKQPRNLSGNYLNKFQALQLEGFDVYKWKKITKEHNEKLKNCIKLSQTECKHRKRINLCLFPKENYFF